jgi:hypothetical protein
MLVGYNIESVQIYFHDLLKLQNNILNFFEDEGITGAGEAKALSETSGAMFRTKERKCSISQSYDE